VQLRTALTIVRCGLALLEPAQETLYAELLDDLAKLEQAIEAVRREYGREGWLRAADLYRVPDVTALTDHHLDRERQEEARRVTR
jgi:hypothetical protein